MKSFRGAWIVCLAFALPLVVVADEAAMLRQMRDAGVITEDELQKFATEKTVKTETTVVTSERRPQKACAPTAFQEKPYSTTPVLLAFAGPVAIPSGTDWDVCGFGFGCIGMECHDFSGVGFMGFFGLLNGELCGVQMGLVNYAYRGKGLQLGFVNVCEDLSGVQIGLINYSSKSAIPVMPLVNMQF